MPTHPPTHLFTGAAGGSRERSQDGVLVARWGFIGDLRAGQERMGVGGGRPGGLRLRVLGCAARPHARRETGVGDRMVFYFM
jgi:hypothetical protein